MKNPIRIQSVILLCALIAQYILGMYANLFVAFPDGAQGGSAWQFAWTQAVVAAHIVLGILLVIGAIVFLIRVLVAKRTAWRTPAILGLIGILAAAWSGSAFIPSQSNPLSYIMSLSFLLAFFAYAWGIFTTRSNNAA